MSKTNYYDIDAMRRKRNRKIKKYASLIVYLMVVVLVITLIMSRQEVRELKHQVQDLTIMVTASRAEVQQPARGGIERQTIEDIDKK